jgi:hypothetical protein
MKRMAIAAMLTGLMVTGIGCGDKNPPDQPQATSTGQSTVSPEVTLTGCLVQGSGPTVFILENARVGDDKSGTPEMYYLVADNDTVKLDQDVNHEVQITGVRDNKPQPKVAAGQKPAEKDLPRLTAKTVTSVADRCTTPAK